MSDQSSTDDTKQAALEADFMRDDSFELDRQMMTKEQEDMLTQLGRDVRAWRPEKAGDAVLGTLIDITDGGQDGKFGGTYPLLIIETPSARLVGVHCFHTTLRREVEKRMSRGTLSMGDTVGIVFKGTQPSDKGNDANIYRMQVRKP